MSIHNREQEYIRILAGQKRSVKDLSERLSISEPTVRRDILAMKEKGLIERKRGMVSLIANSPDAILQWGNLCNTIEETPMT